MTRYDPNDVHLDELVVEAIREAVDAEVDINGSQLTKAISKWVSDLATNATTLQDKSDATRRFEIIRAYLIGGDNS